MARAVARRRPWRLPVPRTLRGRLIAGLVALLAIGCASVGLVTYFAVQSTLSDEVNSELQTATGLAYTCWESQLKQQGDPDQGPPGQTADSRQDSSDKQGANPSTSSVITSKASGPGSLPVVLKGCQGLGEETFVAVGWHGKWSATVIGDSSSYTLSATDEKTLNGLEPQPVAPRGNVAPQGNWSGTQNIPNCTRYLSSAQGTFLLTAISDPDGDGSVYVTGLPLSDLHDQLRRVALAEAIVFGLVLLIAGGGGTLWVRFSLRPLRRVAATASQVAELPLESGEVELPKGVPDTDPATETGQLGLAFNRMLGHVQIALKRRAASETRLRRFAADASHELRTPLAAIRGYSELALRHPGNSPEPVTHALGRVLSEATRMSVLVDDLLLLARLDAGRPLSMEPVDMSRLAIDATSDARVARRGHRWVLELPDDPMLVRGDEHRLYQVLANLLSNAGRHTPDGTTVTVRVSDTLQAGEPGTGPESVSHGTLPAEPGVVLTVTDDGPGIPAGLLPELFERFTRADTSRSHAVNASSTGLGLAIVDAVIAAHHGIVAVTSRPGMTRFTIALARFTEPATPEPRRSDQTGQRRPSHARNS